jgi:hypothetical protein
MSKIKVTKKVPNDVVEFSDLAVGDMAYFRYHGSQKRSIGVVILNAADEREFLILSVQDHPSDHPFHAWSSPVDGLWAGDFFRFHGSITISS